MKYFFHKNIYYMWKEMKPENWDLSPRNATFKGLKKLHYLSSLVLFQRATCDSFHMLFQVTFIELLQ